MRDFLRDAVRASLKPLESLALHLGEPIPFPPIFIISLPRSGSTLLYLLAVRKFRLSYFSNFAMACPASAGLLTTFGIPFGACGGGSSLDNSFGETRGWSGPNQGYRTWNLWFPTDRDFIEPGAIPPHHRRKLRQTVGLVEKAARAPFINKWQRNATRVQALHAVFPEAVFLHLRRDSLLTAQSILLARRQVLSSPNAWFSAKPRGYVHDPCKSQLHLAAEQVALLENDLEEDKATLGRDNFFELDYGTLCRNADAALDAFAAWYGRRTSQHLQERGKLNIRLTESNAIRISDGEATEIANILCAIRRTRPPETGLVIDCTGISAADQWASSLKSIEFSQFQRLRSDDCAAAGLRAMWTQQVRRRREALRLLLTAGAEVRADFGKSRCRQLLEIGMLGLKGYGAADYYLLGLYKDPGLAARFMTNAQYNEARRRLNKPVQGIIEFNKWIFAKYCESLGIPTPHCYGVFNREFGFTEHQAGLRSFGELCDLLCSVEKPIVVKPLAGNRGDGVRVFEEIDTSQQILIGANRTKTTFRQLHDALTGEGSAWLIQDKVEQHPVLKRLHASSVNTARIITLRGDSGDIVILTAALRIGVGGAEVDNTTGGGIAAEIDLPSGVCRAAMSRSSIRPIARHPDSGYQIEGLALPCWDSVKETTVKAHRFLPFARSLGWDVAFGPNGPVVLEVNGSWYYNRVQMTGQSLWETEFGRSLGLRARRKQRLQPLLPSSDMPSG